MWVGNRSVADRIFDDANRIVFNQKNQIMKYSVPALFLLSMTLFISCSEEEDPRAIFYGSYNSEEFCLNEEIITSTIAAGTADNEVLWTNMFDSEDTADDFSAFVTGNVISIPAQNWSSFTVFGSGNLLADGTIDLNVTVDISGFEVLCTIVYSPQ